MPFYTYRCAACHQIFEIQHHMDDPAPVTCSLCSGPLSRLLSPPSLKFVGPGFYATDYKPTPSES